MILSKLSRTLSCIAAIPVGLALLCAAQSGALLTGHITKAGVYVLTNSEKRISEEGSAAGYVTEGGRTFQSAATNVILAKGTAFGLDFRIDGARTDCPVRLTHLITHPKMKKPDGTVLTKQSFDRDVTSGDGTISGRLWYTLREDFELLPGKWSLSVLQNCHSGHLPTITIDIPSRLAIAPVVSFDHGSAAAPGNRWRALTQRFSARVHAYVLMDNHFHLLVETPEKHWY